MTDNKKRTGKYKSLNTKTSDFLPSVFQTNVNKRWLDSTLDQMVSKSDLKSLEQFASLTPAITTKNADGTIDKKLLFSDIQSAIKSNFPEYNYNSAYASAIYGYHPPIDTDKFLNFVNYYWIPELPVYAAVNQTGTGSDNPISDCTGAELFTLVDDNREFTIDNNMLIEFQGSGWSADIRDTTYIITGVGESIQPLPYSRDGKKFYTGESQADLITRGYWDQTAYVSVTPNKQDTYWQTDITPRQALDAYIADANKLPIFEGFLFTNFDSNPEKFTTGQLVKFAGDWGIDAVERAKIYYTYLNEDNNIDIIEVVSTYDDNGNVGTAINTANVDIIADIADANVLELLAGWDTHQYDRSINEVLVKDYHVIAKHDNKQTAWSRNNNWVHRNTVEKLHELMPNNTSLTELLSRQSRAQRPIIEFNAGMTMWDFADKQTISSWLGVADFVLDADDTEYPLQNNSGTLSYDINNLPVPVDSNVILYSQQVNTDYQGVFKINSLGVLVQQLTASPMETTIFVTNAVQDSVSDWQASDVYFADGAWHRGQQKTKANQPPLFQLYYHDGTPLQDYASSNFRGSKVFGYKIGSGEADVEVGLPLSYKDSATGAEYEFENFILTQTVTESFTSSIDKRVSHYWNLPGFYFFKIKNLLKTVYDKNEVSAGTKQKRTYNISQLEDLVIPFGYSNWRTQKEVSLYSYGNTPKISEITAQGVYSIKDRNVLVGTNQTLTIHDLVHYNDIKITTVEGYDLENPPVGASMPDVTVIRSGRTIELQIGNVGDINLNVDFNPDELSPDNADMKIYISNNFDSISHDVKVNGKPLTVDEYQLEQDQIIIPQDKLSVDDQVEFTYYSNRDETNEYTSLPDNLENNPTNELMETFTFSETLDHWTSIISNQPGLVGDAYGSNNYNEVTHISNIGGSIEIHADISAMHDLNYTDSALDITGALIAQGSDWDGFIERFKNQVRRIYATKTYTSVFDLVVDAIAKVSMNRKGSELYKNSNMVYGHKHSLETIELVDSVCYSKYITNGDDNIRDHVYVYLTDDRDNNGKFIQRLLTKDVDYFMVGNRIDLLVETYAHTTLGDLPYLTISYHHMDEDSFVPPSPVKLKLKRAHLPQIVNNQLLTHDGKLINLETTSELDDPTSANFDPVNAALYDLEKRIYAGLIAADKMYGDQTTAVVNKYASIYDFLPSQHRETWYSLATVDQYTERFFQVWKRDRNITEISSSDYYDENDSRTWNYSTIEIGNHFADNRLPGHWVGAYTMLFGTARPDITPWHMLGHATKPTWWDDHYSWTNPVKRQNLLTALETGIIDRFFDQAGVGFAQYQNPNFARHYWEWNTKCPVNESGELVDPNLVLGTPSELHRSQPFVFGDWGPVEQQWRDSAQGYMALIDAVVKLNPARAWTEFFQPGTRLTDVNLSQDINLYTKSFPEIAQYPVPGETYSSIIKSVYFNNTEDRFPQNSKIRIANGNGTIEAKTAISYNAGLTYEQDGTKYSYISGISVTSRGWGYNGIPSVLTSFTDAQNTNSDIQINLTEAAYVASGISQVQYNHLLRKQQAIDLNQLYSTVDVELASPMQGFTSKHLLNMFVESSEQGAYRLGDNDYSINMHQSYPTEFVTASQVTVTKTATGYAVNGLSSNVQEFRFYEPDLSSNTSSVGIGNTTVKKFKSFAGSPSRAEYGTKFAKIQDTYNFVRGYWHWMELNGYKLTNSGDAQAYEFVKWAIGADVDTSVTLEIGQQIKFTPIIGTAVEYNKFGFNKNDILDSSGIRLGNENISIDRVDGSVNVTTKDASSIGSITSATVTYEHVLIFNNQTSRGLLFNDSARHQKYQHVYQSGQVTDAWRGEKNALGYLVFDNHIVQNFDSSVSAVEDYYRNDVTQFNPAITKTKDLSIGNIDRDWISTLGLDKNTVTKFYQGVIKESGTHGVINKIARTDILDHGTTKIDVAEQYMFNQGYFGENKLNNHIEVQLSESDITKNPQIITFGDSDEENTISYPPNSKRIVHAGDPNFASTDYQNTTGLLYTAGEPLETETDYQTVTVTDMPGVFDTESDYATIETWRSDKSYKIGDQVRRNGKLYRCLVNSTGLNVQDVGISVIGTAIDPEFEFGTIANIAGTTTQFNSTSTAYNNIVAQGSVVNPTLSPNETFVLDGRNVAFTKTAQRTVVVGDAILSGNISNPSINNAEGQTITINNATVDFNEDTPADRQQSFTGSATDVTPQDIVETIASVVSEQTYTIDTPLAANTYSVDTVTVDGVESTDFDVVGQDITINDITFAGGEEIEITLVHTTQTLLEDVFTVTTVSLGSVWTVSNVSVQGSSVTGFTVSGQDVIFASGSEPQPGDIVIVTVEHIPASLNTQQIINKINDANIAGVTVSLSTDGFSRLLISYSTTDPDSTLTLSASTTNSLLGFNNSGQVARPPSEIIIINDDLLIDEIATQINSVGVSGVTASVQAERLVLTSTNTEMQLTGTALGVLGLDSSYTASTSSQPTSTTMLQAVQEINNTLANNSITDVIVVIDNFRIKIESENNTLDLGDTDFNTAAGLDTGEILSTSTQIENEFYPSSPDAPDMWEDISSQDPALISVWVADDSAYDVNEVQNVQTKFYGWNVFQATHKKVTDTNNQDGYVSLYTQGTDGSDCGICAGTATSDGNDAEVTTQIDHGLQIGDYVMLLNTTTTPNTDGIHRVTSLGLGQYANRVFYIDKFIEECGNAVAVIPMRTQRFQTFEDMNTATASDSWNMKPGDLSWVNYNAETDERQTTVYSRSNNVWTESRTTTRRVTNADIKNAVIYDADRNQTVTEFEVFDPILGIIPGVADRELEHKTAFDPAVYNVTTDDNYSTDDDDFWAQAQVGQRWWDTSKVFYYDYKQGPLTYRAAHWGKQFASSEIVVWEWTKSTIAPDDYAKTVAFGSKVEMFGTIATGEPFSAFDPIANETLYYYVQSEEWDAKLGKYVDVYYFWVKNKTTINNPDQILTAKTLAEIIANPTANGIGWIAAIDTDSIIISNATYYLNDQSTVLQINKHATANAHNNWMLIAKDKDMIPEYWYIGVRNNLAGQDATDIKLPDNSLNVLNRYGDDRSIKQSWFSDLRDARYNTVLIINDLLKDVNLIEDLASTWDNTLGQLKSDGNAVLPANSWRWTSYQSEAYNEFIQPTYDISSTLELANIDTSVHQVVQLEIIDPLTEVDKSEIYYLIDGVWELAYKNNATIEFNAQVLSLTHGFDTTPYDMVSWDNTFIVEYWRLIVDACRDDLFTGSRAYKFNKLFFGIVEYTLSKMEQVNWVHKSTYVSLYVQRDIDSTAKIYKRDQLNEVLGYINTVKPFHTKISSKYDIHNASEEVGLSLEEEDFKNITVNFYSTQQNFTGTVIDSATQEIVSTIEPTGGRVYQLGVTTGELKWQTGQVTVGGEVMEEGLDYQLTPSEAIFNETPEQTVVITFVPYSESTIDGGEFTQTEYDTEYDFGDLFAPYNYSNSLDDEDGGNHYQSTMVDLRPVEQLSIKVQTNETGETKTADTRTFVYIQDHRENVGVYGLVENKDTVLASDLDYNSTSVELADGSNFADAGFAYVGNEVIKFDRSGDTLYIISRSINSSFSGNHSTGSQIIDVTDSVVSTVTNKTSSQTRFNQPGNTLLQSGDAIAAGEIVLAGVGLEI